MSEQVIYTKLSFNDLLLEIRWEECANLVDKWIAVVDLNVAT
jgi:hypothetical protein